MDNCEVTIVWTPVTFLICYALVLSHKSQTLTRIYTLKCWNSFLFCSFTTQRSELSLNKFVCLFGGFSSHSRIFHLYGDVTIAGEGLQVLTYVRHSWSFQQWGFFSVPHLLWHGASVYNGHLPGPVTLSPGCHYLFLRLRSVVTWDRTPISRTQGESYTSTPSRRSLAFFY